MKLTHNGRKYEVEREYLEQLVSKLGDPRCPVMVNGCPVCKAVCSQGNVDIDLSPLLCECCGKRSRGTTFNSHVAITTVEHLAEKLGRAA